MYRVINYTILLLVLQLMISGCGSDKEIIENAGSKIESLKKGGVKSEALSRANFFLLQAKTARKSGNLRDVRKVMDSLTFYLDKVEKEYEGEFSETKPYVDSILSGAPERIKDLSGMNLKKAEDIINEAKSFVEKNNYIGARKSCLHLDTLIPALVEDQKKSEKIRPLVVGTWRSQKVAGCKGCNAVEKKMLKFTKDGGVVITESMKGQTSEYTKEDWKVTSKGRWDLLGDTIYTFIESESWDDQVYYNLKEKNGKESWIKNEKAAFDTVITDSSKDRFQTYEYMKKNFSKG